MTHPKEYWLTEAKLSVGNHAPNGEACVMEAVSQYAGVPWTDHPEVTDAALGAYCRLLNDRGPQWVRDELQKRIPRLAACKKLADNGIFVFAEAARQSAIRTLGPERSKELAACSPIVDRKTALKARDAAAVAAAYAAYAADAAAADAADAAAHAADAAAYAAVAAVAAAYAADAAADAAVRAPGVDSEWREALVVLDRVLTEAGA